jgi:hypothetical protein
MTQQPKPEHQPATRKGEEMVRQAGKEPGRFGVRRTGANRPAGKATPRSSSGVVTKGAADPQSPYLQPA